MGMQNGRELPGEGHSRKNGATGGETPSWQVNSNYLQIRGAQKETGSLKEK